MTFKKVDKVKRVENHPLRRRTGVQRASWTFLFLIIAAVFFMLQAQKPDTPYKYKILKLANSMVDNMKFFGRVIEETKQFKKLTQEGYTAAGGGITARQLKLMIEQTAKHGREKQTALTEVQNALHAQSIINGVGSANSAIISELKQLEKATEDSPEIYRKVIGGLKQLHSLYTDFTALALAPTKQKQLVRYHVLYRVEQGYIMAAYANLVAALSYLKERGFGQNKILWKEELNKARKNLKEYEESELYFVIADDGNTKDSGSPKNE